MNKIIKSLSVVAFVAAIAIGATMAYFSDTETSENNIFKAGSIDLKIDSTCHYNGMICSDDGQTSGDYVWQDDLNLSAQDPVESAFASLGDSCDCTWTEDDLTIQSFFNFEDLKPGDNGENTISLHVYDNDAWGRISLANTFDLDNTCTEPEIDDEAACETSPTGTEANSGELDDEMQAMIWLDQGTTPGFQNIQPDSSGGYIDTQADPEEGDNIWQGECDEPHIVQSVVDPYELAGLIKSAYSGSSCSGGSGCASGICPGLTVDGHMVGSITYYIGSAWCFGQWDNITNPTTAYCNGALSPDGTNLDNTSQTDSLGGDIVFEVVQYRNNVTGSGASAVPISW